MQAVTLFVVIPLGTLVPNARVLLDACHLVFATICATVLTRHPVVRTALIGLLGILAIGTLGGERVFGGFHATNVQHEIVALTAFAFNGAITALVARHVFGTGRVTVHRIQGAVLLYLNAASLFAIAYGLLEALVPGALVATGAGRPSPDNAALTYFSLVTVTTTGYGDILPIHPIARSIANLESVFGHLFPATLLARLVALQLAHDPQTP